MATRLHDQKEDLLSGAIARLHDKLDKRQAKLGEAFLRHYYRSVAPVDLVDRDAPRSLWRSPCSSTIW